MAGLFGRTKLRQRAQAIATDQIEGYLKIVQLWHYDYHHGTLKQDKETSREQQYNQDFFTKILGYRESLRGRIPSRRRTPLQASSTRTLS